MTFLGACITRRLLSDIRTWPSAHFFRPTSVPKAVLPSLPRSQKRHHTTIFDKLSRQSRAYDAQKIARFTKKLIYLLRKYSGRDHGLENDDDDFVSIQLLLSHPEFHEMSMPSLQRIIDEDIKHRFEIKFDPSRREGNWWIRARQWNEPYHYLKPLSTSRGPPQAVYKTTLDAWNTHISRNGIPRLRDEYIELNCGIPTETYLDDLKERDELFIFVDIDKCIQRGMRFYIPTPPPQPLAKPSHLLTKGDEYGFIPTSCIVQADRVQTKKELLWGDDDIFVPQTSQAKVDERKRERKTILRSPDWNLTHFADLPSSSRPHPRTLEEAKAVISAT